MLRTVRNPIVHKNHCEYIINLAMRLSEITVASAVTVTSR